MNDTLIFERDEHIYLVAPVAPYELADTELDELAWGEDVRKMAPNERLMWLRGQYVESEQPNRNGQMWTAGDLEIASLTPNLMPVTVMHDPRSAVGLIADARLVTRDVPRSRIDTTLAVWRHRFPEVAEEAMENFKLGSLQQSMECLPRWYECLSCGKRYPKLPDGSERAMWCRHLEEKAIGAAKTTAARRLGQVAFTGTGLIFGTRGASGAYDEAHLEALQEEVAEFHQRATAPTKPRRKNSMEIDDKRYEELVAAESKVKPLTERVATLEEEAARVPDLERKVEEEETARKAAETARDEAKRKVDEAEEQARAATLAKDRLGTLGRDFTAKLGEFTRGRLEEQAGSLSDEDWDNRIKELEEVAGVKRDQGGKADENAAQEGTFSREETARTQVGGNGGSSGEPSGQQRRSVVAGLVKQRKK
jgi:hypothetical protein